MAANLLSEKLNNILNEMAPVKTIQIRKQYAPWLTKDTKLLLSERNNAQKYAAQTGDADDWRLYKILRNSATSTMRSEKKAWEKKRLDHIENNSTNIWRNIKTWINWKVSGPPTQLFQNGETIRSPAGLADTMNSFFVQKVQRLSGGIPDSHQDRLQNMREIIRERECQFALRPVTPDEVLDII